ncbi:MAG: hypothetical protein M0026_06005 [Nocardiopsaceae bacterium]|nr:hypothetical protein [Nocardiopsaceae bacterium]
MNGLDDIELAMITSMENIGMIQRGSVFTRAYVEVVTPDNVRLRLLPTQVRAFLAGACAEHRRLTDTPHPLEPVVNDAFNADFGA